MGNGVFAEVAPKGRTNLVLDRTEHEAEMNHLGPS